MSAAAATLPPALAPTSGVFAQGAHHFPVRVYFEDTDAGGVVYHANYLRFMERARSDMLRLLGISQRGALDDGAGVYAVSHLDIAFRAPAKLDDELVVISRMTGVGGATVSIAQQVKRGQTLLAEASVTVAFLSAQGRPRRQPREWVALFTSITSGEPSPQ
ncbi:tol-pal system-associated acyl-CoA thioesterase [Sphingobium sp. DEHP117]|uniref:tol-pal system-associated acyl-CoA thioesterase n=1 Tax=Sphingobium sp. DEHP117 TaxID=2993436 RepID=UPI0027D5E2B1|nr:tol-pal system-associated acyl-CoA thioesterase [Sphingobium sp. DEHP117]MDQ4420724.1 tol-pal system-associated acyl-CoA thioesterase [Sphingobium sp. DEHP117]